MEPRGRPGRRRLGSREGLSAWAAAAAAAPLLLLLLLLPVPAASSSPSAASAGGAGSAEAAKECEKPCANGGRCQPSTGQCECPPGWVGEQCQHCGGRFRFNVCPRSCSGRGECRLTNSSKVVECECSGHWKGEACDVPYCPEDCGSPERGQCSRNVSQGCACYAGWQGVTSFPASGCLSTAA